jgi:ribosome maturation factor RimP
LAEQNAMTTATSIRERVIGLTEPLLEQLGFELVDVEWAGGPRDGVLRFYIDLPGGVGPEGVAAHIGIEDCARASRELSALLDVDDPVPGHYSLEVSSPGFDRVLRKPQHYGRFVGSKVRVELLQARDGRRRYTGTLTGVGETDIELDVEGMPVRVPFAEIGKSRLVA